MGKVTTAAEISKYLSMPLNGEDCSIVGVSSYEHPRPNTMIFVERPRSDVWERISMLRDALVICPSEFGAGLSCATIWTQVPRLNFIRAVNRFFIDRASTPFAVGVGAGSIVSPQSSIGRNVSIGCNCVLGPDVQIGTNTVILNNVVISGRTRIGDGCLIKSGAVIGETGFGFCLDEEGVPLQMPHFGGVEIGHGVSVGANSTVERGIFDDTVISENVKIDDLVQIGHNARVESAVRIAAGTVLCGGVRVGCRSWIAPNVSVRENVRIGSDAYIGLAANVIADVPDGTTVFGNPARERKG